MAAVEDEGSQSENKNEDASDKNKGKPFSTMHQEIESKLTKPGISYEDRVDIILSGWEHLAGTASSGQLLFATFLYNWTLKLVLQGEWPRLEKIVKTRLKATLQRCTLDQMMRIMCGTLLPLVTDPWGHPTLKAIIGDAPVSDEEVEQYIREETWPVVKVRINTLVESRCEKLALSVLKVCMRYIRLSSNSAEMPLLNSQEDHNHFVDLYFILLYKYDRHQFVEEIKEMDFMEGANHVRRLLAQQEKGKVWKSRLKVAKLEIQIFVTSCIVKPFETIFSLLFEEYCNVMKEVDVSTEDLTENIRTFLRYSESAQHIYRMGSIFYHKFGDTQAALVTELLIRALTSDMNALEAVKMQAKEGTQQEQIRLEHQMAEGFMDLSIVFSSHESVARECVLTAFSLHPTQTRLERLKSFGSVKSEVPNYSQPSEDTEVGSNEANLDGVCPEVKEVSTLPAYSNNDAPSYLEDMVNKDNENLQKEDRVILVSSDSPETELVDVKCEKISLVSVLDTGQNSLEMLSSCSQEVSLSSKDSCNIHINNVPLSETEVLSQAVKNIDEHRNYNETSVNKFEAVIEGEMNNKLPINLVHIRKNDHCGSKDDIWEFVNESSANQSVKPGCAPKIKDDVDSMDGFLATTEGLIKQLNQEQDINSDQSVEEAVTSIDEVSKNVTESPPTYDIFTDPKALLNEEMLGLSKELCEDLAVVLSSPRWQVLSWMQEISKLLNICEKYMNDVDSAKNVTKELKFLNIDYSQFKHLPSVEVDEYTGIEKGYEHFMERESDLDDEDFYTGMQPAYSSGSDYESCRSRGNVFPKRGRRGRPPLRNRYFNSDSDSAGRSIKYCRNRTAASLSESEDSDFESLSSAADKDDKTFEGKRVTAVSTYDRRKRLRIDATTGRVKRPEKTTLLRLYRHNTHSTELLNPSEAQQYPSNTSTYTSCSVNKGTSLKPGVVLNHYNRSSINNRVPNSLNSEVTMERYSIIKTEASNSVQVGERKPSYYKPGSFQRGRYGGNWRYAGYVISKPPKDDIKLTCPSLPSQSDVARCSYRTKEGKLVTLNTHNYSEEEKPEVEYLRKLGNPSKFEESFAKFLMQQKSCVKEKLSSSITDLKKPIPLEERVEYLKRQGTSVIMKPSNNSTTALATAQKNVLNEIMSPENSRLGIVGRTDEQLPVRAIAMPVSHNSPNLPPSDKNNPTGLSRVLPKGTTVVRRPKIDTGAGPSGLNNGGTSGVISRNPVSRTLGNQPRPTISITPSNFLGSGSPVTFPNTIPIRTNLNQTSLAANFITAEGPSTSFSGSSQTENERFSPLASATVVGSVSQTLSPRLSSNNSPGETQGGCFASLNLNRSSYSNLSQAASCTASTTVATLAGEARAPSMLETLLRDRSTPSSPLLLPLSCTESTAHTTTSTSINEPIVASSPITGSSVSASSLSEALNLVTSQTSSDISLPLTATITGNASVALGNNSASSSVAGNINLGVSNIPLVGSSVLSSSLPVISSGVGTHVTVTAGGTSAGVEPQPAGMHQLLLPAQFIQVQGSDGSTGLGIVHSGSLDLRLPPGTRVIKSSTSNIRPSAPVAITQSGSRPLNLLHNLKIVQNRQIVRTVVVPHSVALQSIGASPTAQLVALSQGPGASNNGLETQTGTKISSTQLQKMLGHNIVPGGLAVIRAVRPSLSESNEDAPKPFTTAIIQHTSEIQQQSEKDKGNEKPKPTHLQTQEEGLAERLNRHYLKNAFLASTSTQSVGTQTQTTAVKPVTGQLVMNHLRGISNSNISSIPVATTSVVANAISSPGLSSLSLGSSNAVSSETLEQLREFESVFEKVSNKSVKETETTTSINQQNFQPPNVSSEESMIAAQLLSMSNETPVTTSSNYVYTIPTTSSESSLVTLNNSSTTASLSSSVVSSARLGEGTFITIPSSTQGGTLILVNPSVSTTCPMTIAGTVQTNQPPPAASPALSSTSSHSSIASSPSSTSSKSKSKSSKSKGATPSSTPVTPTKPKSPPPPKVPPKPAVAKPQVEESDETKARIQAILDQYKQDLANTPQPQPAPRNRKNCPPPKNEGKSSNKKKNQVKKPDGTSSTSPCTSESGHLPSASASPAPLAVTPSGEDSDGSIGGASVASSHFHSPDEKKPEEPISPQILQGVVVSNVKVDSSSLGNSLPALSQGRVVQLIRHGSKVTAITTRQPYQKSKTGLSSGGPPPNVTIQGRINMNELMESHLASLLAQGSATINSGTALITKLLQAQQQQSPTVQQLVLQTSSGMGQQVIQQVALQPVIAAPKVQQIHGQIISGTISMGDSINHNTNSLLKTSLQTHQSPVMSVGISPSPGTPQQRVSSPSTPSPAPELPSTPSSFPTVEDSNSSDESNGDTSAAPLPPFFTLTKQFMSPQQSQQFSEKLRESSPALTSSDTPRSSLKLSSDTQSNNSSGVNLNPQASRSSSFIRSSFTKSLSVNCPISKGNTSKSNISGAVGLAHNSPPSPLETSGDNVLDMSPASGPSSLENSPSIISHRLPLVTASELKTNSLDSIKSDLSVEEVQIPPSPATLTKQLQNAYMTEAALSPTVSHSHLSSSSSYSSPTTVQDLQSTGEPRIIFPNLGHTSHTYSLAGHNNSTSSLNNNSNCSASHNNPSIENNTLACLSSPSGDVYLDQAGVGLGLDGLPLVEGRSQSPSLSDLVPAVPLLSWSPRSADSIMDQSPSLNEALTGNMTLDVHHSEDSLCDSSTGFPGLFSMDNDAASASSTNSDDILSSTTNPCPISTASTTTTVFAIAPSQSRIQATSSGSFGKRLPNHEQDHTVSSTRTENILSRLRTPEISQSNPPPECEDIDLTKSDETSVQEHSWKFGIHRRSNVDSSLSDDSSNDKKSESCSHSVNVHHTYMNQSGKSLQKCIQEGSNCKVKKISEQGRKKRKSQRQIKEHKNDLPANLKQEEIVHNGYEKVGNVKNESDDEGKPDELLFDNKNLENEAHDLDLKSNLLDKRVDSLVDDKKLLSDLKTEAKSDDFSTRLTRGSKRRSDSDFVQGEKRSRSSRSRRSEPSDLSPEEEKFPNLFEDGPGGPITRALRGRHISGTSDSSSNYSIDRVSTPGPQDSPAEVGSGSSRRRKRRGSHDSSVSSRDGSPLTVLLNSQDGIGSITGGMHTRRSSSRDHAKKTRCRCCVDQSSPATSSGRRPSGRMSRWSGPNTSAS